MRPVNLLPERNRPRGPSGGQKGSSYFLLGGLALVLIGAVVYVLTLNSINSARDQVTSANAQATRDNALADQLTPYGNFEKIKTQRVASVMQLAQSRFDWERMTRELTLSPDQQKQLGPILDDMQAKFRALHEQIAPQAEQIRQEGRARIRALLTPEQEPKFEDFVRRFDEQKKKKNEQ